MPSAFSTSTVSGMLKVALLSVLVDATLLFPASWITTVAGTVTVTIVSVVRPVTSTSYVLPPSVLGLIVAVPGVMTWVAGFSRDTITSVATSSLIKTGYRLTEHGL